MFPVEMLPAHYYEERSAAAEAARKLAQQQQEAAAAQQQQQQAAQVQTAQQHAHATSIGPTPATSISQAFPTPLSRPPSSGVLASIFQGLVRNRSQSPASSIAPTRTHTPAAQPRMTEQERREAEALAELKRDTDIVRANQILRYLRHR
jgi:hypothetical protein